ncbi:MAG: PilZ domain-containing protein [Candidatus Omnitrophica bacterium]|nr:PilZ domain-containing protein [Candidatus Omnitrophota bacterium]
MEDKNSRQERRGARRIKKNLIIQYSMESAPELRKWDVSSVRDISEKGVSFITNGKFPLGIIVHMFIRIPLKPFEWFEVSGKVVDVEESRTKSQDPEFNISLVRIAFMDLKEEQKILIREYIAWCLSKDGGKK